MQVHVAAIALNSKAENRARSVLNGWARDRTGIKAGSYREAELQKELDTVSRGIDTFNSEVFARYGGQQKTARRYRELKDMLARPLPYSIRIDTFEIWRSERIYPDGVTSMRLRYEIKTRLFVGEDRCLDPASKPGDRPSKIGPSIDKPGAAPDVSIEIGGQLHTVNCTHF